MTGFAPYTVSSVSTNNVTSTHLTEEQAVKLGYTVIKSAQDLANIANDPDGKYMLMCDIELSSGWKSIADFTGEFNGNGYTISKLDSALFATTSGATISNLSVQGNVSNGAILVDFAAGNTVIDHVTGSGTVSGSAGVGGLVIHLDSSTIKCSSFSGQVTASGSMNNPFGGLAAMILNSNIEDSYANVILRINEYTEAIVGGLVGVSESSTIKNTYVLGGSQGRS